MATLVSTNAGSTVRRIATCTTDARKAAIAGFAFTCSTESMVARSFRSARWMVRQRPACSRSRRAQRGGGPLALRRERKSASAPMPRMTAAYVPTRPTSVSTTAPAWRNTIATASTTAANENTSRNSSA